MIPSVSELNDTLIMTHHFDSIGSERGVGYSNYKSPKYLTYVNVRRKKLRSHSVLLLYGDFS